MCIEQLVHWLDPRLTVIYKVAGSDPSSARRLKLSSSFRAVPVVMVFCLPVCLLRLGRPACC